MSWRARGKGIVAGAALAAFLSTPAAAYYHFTHYTRTSAPFQPIQEKFDLNALPNKTLTFYVSDNGPTQLLPNDSFASVIGAFRQAIQVWDSVGTSDLRLAFGGLYNQSASFNTPVAQIVFNDDMPPGIFEIAGPTAKLSAGPTAPFVAITGSTVMVPRNLTQNSISSSEAFFTIAVHEIGHALGLQHTWTSSAMSTTATRATTHARPIDTDDIAGITLLYPKAGALAVFGSISGRVMSGGQPVHLASVVALRPGGSAIGTLTQPDGTYRIDGLPPDTYWVYTQALPPAVQSGLGPGDIQLPLDLTGRPVQPFGTTETLFYPGTRDPNAFLPVQVRSGGTVNLNDFNVQRRPAPAIYDVTTYGYYGNVPNSPAFVNSTTAGGSIVASGPGLISTGTTPAPGLAVQALGGVSTSPGTGSTLPVNVRPYTPSYITLDVFFPPFSSTGARHLFFMLPNDAYVLPNGLNLVQKAPPAIASVSSLPDGTVAVSGAMLGVESRVYFDSLPAVTRGFTGSEAGGTLTVIPPLGASSQVAAVTVYNSDGQNSTFAQPVPPAFAYGPAASAAFVFNSSTNLLPTGASSMIDITGVNTQFVDGQTAVGIGSSDITVRRVWVLSPNHLWANVVVAPNAAPGAYTATVLTGFQLTPQQFAFQVVPGAATNRPNIVLPLVNAASAQGSIYAGAPVSLLGTNLAPPSGSGITLTLADQPVTILGASASQINFVVPSGMPTGPAVLKLNNGASDAFPVVIQIDSPPVVIASVLSSQNQAVDAGHPDGSGDIVGILLQNLDPAAATNPARVHLLEGGIDLAALAVIPAPGQPGIFEAFFALSPSVASQQVQLVVTVDGVASNPVIIAIR